MKGQFMQRSFILLAAIFGFLGVALGAFGTHGLRATLEANGRLDTYQTAVEYQMIHALALLGAAWLSERYSGRWTRWAGYSFAAGIAVFSGSLYILSSFNLSIMGAVAPVGGALLLVGWACLGLAVWRS
jgi:uncharacterized membrane protein YgdD (TMEM256/DUF423 family)